jgi:hypothetical protein
MSHLRGKKMKNIVIRLKNQEGNVLITAFIFLVILTLIGIFATQTARMDIQIASNEIPYKRNFYIAEGGLYREAAEIGRGNYPIQDINTPKKWEEPEDASGAPHTVFGVSYDPVVEYVGFFPPPPGYSAIHFVRYDYNVNVEVNRVIVDSRLYRIGPKTE